MGSRTGAQRHDLPFWMYLHDFGFGQHTSPRSWLILAVTPLKEADGLMPWFEFKPILSLGKGSATAPAVVSRAQ